MEFDRWILWSSNVCEPTVGRRTLSGSRNLSGFREVV